MNSFLQAEASYLSAPEDIEPITRDVDSKYLCEVEGCPNKAECELSWPMEDHDLVAGFFCESCLNKIAVLNFEKLPTLAANPSNPADEVTG